VSALDDYVGTWNAIEDSLVIKADGTGVWHSTGGADEPDATTFALEVVNGQVVAKINSGPEAGRMLYLRVDGKGHLFVSYDMQDAVGVGFCDESATDTSPCYL
jgi:hypothetical protein